MFPRLPTFCVVFGYVIQEGCDALAMVVSPTLPEPFQVKAALYLYTIENEQAHVLLPSALCGTVAVPDAIVTGDEALVFVPIEIDFCVVFGSEYTVEPLITTDIAW